MPPSVAAIMRGADYQALFTWNAVLLLLDEDDGIEYVGIEAADAYPADDVVIARAAEAGKPSEYLQIKYHVSKAGGYSSVSLVKSGGKKRPSFVRGFWNVWVKKRDEAARLEIGLVSNWGLVSGDPLGRYLRDEAYLHSDIITRPSAAARKCMTKWKGHLKCKEEQLLAFLAVLRLKLNEPSYLNLFEQVKWRMRGLDLRSDPAAVALGERIAKEWMTQGVQRVTREALEEALDRNRLRLKGGRPTSAKATETALERQQEKIKSVAALKVAKMRKRVAPREPSEEDRRLEQHLVRLQRLDRARDVLALVRANAVSMSRRRRA